MGPLDQLNHLINFFAPALAVGALLAVFGPFVGGKRALPPGLIAQIAMNFIAGSLALGVGLWFFGRDGKMAGYAAMLACCTISQWAGGRRWR